MTDALHVVAERVRFRSGTHDHHIARAQATFKAPVQEHAVDQAAKTQRQQNQSKGRRHDTAGMSSACTR